MKTCTGIVLASKNNTQTSTAVASLQHFCTDVFVVTTNEELAIQNVAVYFHALDNDFAGHRNWAMQQAKNDWTAWLDSDEYFDETAIAYIQALPDNPDESAYSFKRIDSFWGKHITHGEVADSWVPRLTNRNKGAFQRPVHEVWSGSQTKANGLVYHTPHTSIASFLESVNRYSTINAAYFNKQGKKQGIVDMVIRPIGKFFYTYFVKQGYKDGMPGVTYSALMSFHSFLTRAKLYMLQHEPEL